MKVEVKFGKTESGEIVAEIHVHVLNQGDFPTAFIFAGEEDYPSSEGFTLKKGYRTSIFRTLPTSNEAEEWADVEIKALQEKLRVWEKVIIPLDYEEEV